jgi:hypothetical protein
MTKQGKFRCSKCGRVFAMAAHLGRHTATIHSPKGQLPIGRAVGKSVGFPFAGARGNDGRVRLLRQLQASRTDIAAEAAAATARLAAIDEVLALFGGSARASVAPRKQRIRGAARPGTLREYIGQVLGTRRGPVPVREITAGVLRAGFKSRDKELTKSVGKCLLRMPGVVKVARGTFQLK